MDPDRPPSRILVVCDPSLVVWRMLTDQLGTITFYMFSAISMTLLNKREHGSSINVSRDLPVDDVVCQVDGH